MLPLGPDVSQAGVVQGVELVQVRWAGNMKLGGIVHHAIVAVLFIEIHVILNQFLVPVMKEQV